MVTRGEFLQEKSPFPSALRSNWKLSRLRVTKLAWPPRGMGQTSQHFEPCPVLARPRSEMPGTSDRDRAILSLLI
jgi:hypothetical protein